MSSFRPSASNAPATIRHRAQATISDPPFDVWRLATFTAPQPADPSSGGPAGDTERDGIPTLIEYASDGTMPEATCRRHDARGDVKVLGEAMARLRERLGLDEVLNGIARHQTFLPVRGR